MDVTHDSWLSEIMKLPVYKVSVQDAFKPEALQQCIEPHAKAFCYAKLSTQSVAVLGEMTQAGFKVVETNLTFSYQYKESNPIKADSSLISVDAVKPEDEEEVLAIAGSCFKYARFHVDPWIEKEVADQIKHDWIKNYIAGARGEALFAARDQENVIGFLAVLVTKWNGQDCAVIDLMGVSTDEHRKGVGSALVRHFQQTYREQYPVLLVGTQAANIPSIRLYEKNGFRVCDTKYVVHYHKGIE